MIASAMEIGVMTAQPAAVLADPPCETSSRPAGSAAVTIGATTFTALAEGALWLAAERVLVVADLHFEKGSSFARRGQLLPPYDTAATLAALTALIFRFDPACVVALGDSFHDNDGVARMAPYDRAALAALQRGRDWVWIAGNHDDELPIGLAGDHATELALGEVTLRHEPSERPTGGEIAGHLHPAARVFGRSGSVRRRCFVASEERAVLPAFGALTGGLNVLAPVFAPLFPDGFIAYVMGADAVYPVAPARLAGG
jgi:DNA ligase-associated metallophosphoesterase